MVRGVVQDLAELEYVVVRSHSETLRILQMLRLEERIRLTAGHFLALPAIVGGTSAAAGAAATAPLGWKAMRRTGGRMGVVGGVIGGGMALAARTGYKREKAKHGMWTYETSRRSDEKFARNTVRRGRQATLAGNPNPDGEGFYGFNSRRASRLPGDTTTTE